MKLQDVKPTGRHYLAFVLDEQSRDKLLRIVPPKYNAICHHVTIEFTLTQDKFDEMIKHYGVRPKVEVLEFYQNATHQGFIVRVGKDLIRPDGKVFHLTHSMVAGGQARKTAELVDDKANFVYNMNTFVTGELKLVNK